MALKNVTKKTIISKKHECFESVWPKARGLMFSSPRRIKDNSLVFVFDRAQRWGLHMWFVFFPIDVLFLDENKCVVEIKERFVPFSYYRPRQDSMYVIELGVGGVHNSLTSVGDVLTWK